MPTLVAMAVLVLLVSLGLGSPGTFDSLGLECVGSPGRFGILGRLVGLCNAGSRGSIGRLGSLGSLFYKNGKTFICQYRIIRDLLLQIFFSKTATNGTACTRERD